MSSGWTSRSGSSSMAEERAANARGLRLAVESNTVLEWVGRQLDDLQAGKKGELSILEGIA